MKESAINHQQPPATPKSGARTSLVLAALCLVSALTAPVRAAVSFADSVVGYTSGTGVLAGYSNPIVALGAPTLSLAYQPFVDPFNPPYETSNLVSIGVGGQLTVGFSAPLLNAPGNPYGLDFIIYGHDGFVDTNYPFGQTDGVLFSTAYGVPGVGKVFVSSDGANFFELRPPAGVSAAVDTLFPTDGAGVLGVPVNPALTNSDFANLDLAGIRALYNGSAGGTGFDLAWAVDTNGFSVVLPDASYVRLEGIENVISIDAIASAVPEPATWALMLTSGVLASLVARRRRLQSAESPVSLRPEKRHPSIRRIP